jgi:hypothetical protein
MKVGKTAEILLVLEILFSRSEKKSWFIKEIIDKEFI